MIDKDKINDEELGDVSGGFIGGNMLQSVSRLGRTSVANPMANIGAGAGSAGSKKVQQSVEIHCVCGAKFRQTWYVGVAVDPECCLECGAPVAFG